ncbi:recombinase family protein (plasmid) [Sulfurimonas aquatica]|uniref:Recombinase family protein n=1 Tax=Sulfurimonas aquatica TaxID=2672570 RepID=A0A975B2X4_9BACT|nr:recombinase family protein [Sulfurimonas aquatica]QSZ43173.1 recombinase family protein [Sulfurimonas aquatica]
MNVGYARVSTSSQNLENQIDQLKESGCEKIFSEKRSGKNEADRKEFKIMMEFIREGDVLFITKHDRLARSVIDLQNIAKFLEDKNVDLKVIQQNIDTTTPAGRLLFTMLGAITEFERDLINERVKEGIEAAKKKGVQFGRRAILNNKEKNVIYKEREKGKSVAWLSKFFHVARNTIYRAIKDVAKKK